MSTRTLLNTALVTLFSVLALGCGGPLDDSEGDLAASSDALSLSRPKPAYNACYAVKVAHGYCCTDVRGQAVITAYSTCANVRCSAGYTCQEIPTGNTCPPTRPACVASAVDTK